jgi:outer membrane protein OmpA-like peptidoglycan-associated protein
MQYTTQQEKRLDGSGAAPIVFRFVALAMLALAAPISAQVADPPQTMATYTAGVKGKVVGAIISRNGDELIVRRENSNEISRVSLIETTRVESPSGLLNVDRKRQDLALLVPGLFVKVRGQGGPTGTLIAERISFHKTALKVANQISAGEVDLRRQINANVDSIEAAKARARDSLAAYTERARDSLAAFNARVANLDNYSVKFSGTVNFATGSAELSTEAKQQLDALMDQGKGLSGYLVEVVGYTDDKGTAAYNQRLSERRTDAVVAYLAKANVPLRRIVNPTGLGESHPVGSNETAEGRAENRRVEVKVLVNKGLEQTTGKP